MKCLIYKLLFAGLVLIKSNAFTQVLSKSKLSKQHDTTGIVEEYLYKPKESHEFISLRLYKNGEYYYEEGTLSNIFFNVGKWKFLNKELILNDNLDKNNLPVSVICFNKSDTINSFIIRIVQNLKGEYLTDGFVYINNDSCQCLPLTGTCLGKYNSIDSLKIVFENGFKSKWIPVTCQGYKQLGLTLNSNLSMGNSI